MRLKYSASVSGLRPEMVVALIVAREVYRDFGFELVVTSGTDSKHSPGSLHYVGLALDFRTKHMPKEKWNDLADEMRSRLGPDYDVVIEPTHMHVEFQPKSAK